MAITKITNSLVAVNAIAGTLIADNAITSVHIAQNQVTSVQIPDSSITSTQLAANSVDTAELISGSIDAIHLASDSVTTAKILDANVTTAKIANNAITSALIPDGSITDTQLGSGAFTMGNITTTGSIRGPASLTIDPATVGDNTGTVVIAGNLQVDGTTTTVNSTTLDVVDKNITLGKGGSASANNGGGITIDGAAATMLYTHATTSFDFNKPVNVTGAINSTGTGRAIKVNGTTRINSVGDIIATSYYIGSTAIIDTNSNLVNIGTITSSGSIKTTGLFEVASSQPRILLDRNDGSYSWNIYNGDGSGNFPTSTFNIANNAGTAVITALDSGNVGIGTTGPGFALDISNTTSAKINLQGGTNQNGIRFAAAGNDGVSSSLYYLGVGSDLMSGTDYGAVLLDVTNNRSVLFDDQSNSRLGFYNNSMIINSSGNVGIGATPSSTIRNDITSAEKALQIGNRAMFFSDGGVTTDLQNNSHLTNSDSRVAMQTDLGSLYQQYQGIHKWFNAASVSAGATQTMTERMRIDSSGNIQIRQNTNAPTNSVSLPGHLEFRGQGWDSNSGSDDMNAKIEMDATYGKVGSGATSPELVFSLQGAGGLDSSSEAYVEAMRIVGAGAYNSNIPRVGIGQTAPATTLHIGDGASHYIRIENAGSGDVSSGYQIYRGSSVGMSLYDNPADNTTSLLCAGSLNINAGGSGADLHVNTGGNVGTGGITSPAQNLVVGTTTNYDPPGLGNSNANFAILKKDSAAGGDYGIITGISSDGNVWSQVQRVDGTATGYNYYLQPSGGSVGIGVPQNHVYIPNLIYPLRVAKQRSGTGNVTDYLSKISIDGMGYGGSNYQMAALDFSGGNTAGKSGVDYGRIGCSSMNGANNQHEGSLEFYVHSPSFGMTGTDHALKIHGQVNTASAGGGTTRNGVLFTYQGLAIDRSWANYPCINVMNSTPYSSTASTQAELRIHGNNVSSASYPGTSGSDFSCTVRADGGYATGSDRRRKRNITTIDNALDTVKQLTGKRFQTVNRVEEVQEHVSKNGYKLGFIAQEVEDIIPEAVQYHADEDDGTENWNSAYAMDYGSVVALLVNAIKEQDSTIQDLKTRITTLEG